MPVSELNRKRTLTRWLIVISLVLNATVGMVAVRDSRLMRESAGYVATTLRQQEAMNEVLALITDAETGSRGYLITEREVYLDPYHAALARLPDQLDRLRTLLASEPGQSQLLSDTEPVIRQKLESMANRTRLLKSGRRDDAIRDILTDEGRRSMDDIRRAFARMREESTRLLQERESHANERALSSDLVSLALVSANVLLLVVAVVVHRIQKWRQIVTINARDKTVLHDGEWIGFDQYLREHMDLCVSHSVAEDVRGTPGQPDPPRATPPVLTGQR